MSSSSGSHPPPTAAAPTSSTSSANSSPTKQQQSSPARPLLSASGATTRRSFLGKIPALPRVSSARRLIPFRSSAGQQRASLSAPLDPSAPPLGTLVIKVLAATKLIAKDRNGLSDPYCQIRYSSTRITGPTISKSLEPIWGTSTVVNGVNGVGQECKLETKVYESRAFGRERIEIVIYDRDFGGRREYLGEVSLGIHDWWGNKDNWTNGAEPPVGFMDQENTPVWHSIRSSKRTAVTGQLLVQVGFTPSHHPTSLISSSPSSPSSLLSPSDRQRILSALQRLYEDLESNRRESKEELVLLASPTEGVGTKPIEDHSPLGVGVVGHHVSPDDEDDEISSSEDEEGSETESDGEESDTEGEVGTPAVGDTSTEDEDGPSKGYFDKPPPTTSTSSEPLRPIVASPSPLTESLSSTTTSPAIIVDSHPEPDHTSPPKGESTSSTTSTSTASAIKRTGLSLPHFMKRTGSSKSVASNFSTKESEVSDTGGSDSGLMGASGGGSGGGKKRFSRKKTSVHEVPSSSASTSLSGLEPHSTGGTSGTSGTKRRKKEKKVKEPREKRENSAKLGRRKTKRDYRYSGEDDLFGLVQIEVKSASNLPRFKNMLKTGFDMDAFVVVSFGKRVFRTRVIRHSLNPVWDEKLFFPVRQLESSYTVAFNVFDWDKVTSNDHVGDVVIPLSDLLGSTIQPDERGLYPAGENGRLLGDDFHDHELKVTIADTERDPSDGSVSPTLQIRAKFTPYDALRQQFLRTYLRLYDIDENGSFSHLEIFSMLDSLGSSLSKETIQSFFTRFGKTDDQELTADEVILCLEHELKKSPEEKRTLPESGSGNGTGGVPSSMPTPDLSSATTTLNFSPIRDPKELEEKNESLPNMSSNMKPIEPGTTVVTNEQEGTTVKAPSNPQAGEPVHSSGSSQEATDDTGVHDTVERVINIRVCPMCHKPRMRSEAELDIVTHMGICSSTDPRSVNRIVVGEFVTASQAQRKWFTKIISKATKGAYQLGADSANIIVQDRLTGTLQEEKMAVYVRLGIRLAYRGMGVGGGMDGARIRRMLESMSFKQGIKFDSPASVREIAPFIAFHNLNMEEALDPVSSFKNFNEFFYRKLKPGARPVSDPDDPKTLVSPADCRAMFFPTIDDATRIWIKGRDFSISRLLGEKFKDQAHLYEGGSLAIFRLAPQDYHRYHSPVDGVCGPQHKISGKYYTVNPMAIRSAIDVYGENVRLVSPIASPVFGDVMNVWVGAMMVGSICMTCNEGDEIKRGEECGYFKFGGSTILTLYKPGAVVFDSDLVQNSANSVETLVRMGMRVGRKA